MIMRIKSSEQNVKPQEVLAVDDILWHHVKLFYRMNFYLKKKVIRCDEACVFWIVFKDTDQGQLGNERKQTRSLVVDIFKMLLS